MLTARSEGKLKALAAEIEAAHGVKAHVFTADLGAADGPSELIRQVTEAGL